jgi:hypothetical protein
MSKVIRIVKASVAVLIVGFVLACVIGIYIAMDSFGKEGSPLAVSQAEATERGATSSNPTALVRPNFGLTGENTDVAGDDSANGESASSLQPQASGQTSASTPQGSSGSTANTSVPAPVSGGGSDSTASTPTADSSSNQIWHEPWDEWVSEGHYEDHYIEAVYGQRDVFGSVCNTCGLDISGNAFAHLKATQHSGYHEGVIGTESYIIKPSTTEQIWVDTSHSIHHEGYWQ